MAFVGHFFAPENPPPILPWKYSGNSAHSKLESPLVRVPTSIPMLPVTLTLADCLRGIQIFGSTGSGKTSGSGALFAKSFLNTGYGGLVLCVKSDEAETWRKYAKETGRESDLKVICPGSGHVYNFLEEEWKRSKGSLVNVTQALIDVQNLYVRYGDKSGTPSQDGFWVVQLQTLLTHAVTLSRACYGVISARSMLTLIREALDHSASPSGPVSGVSEFQKRISLLDSDLFADSEVQSSVDYFYGEFKNMAYKTRSIIIAMATSICEPLERQPLRDLFSGTTTLRPEETLDGKIIVVDLSVHEFKKAGLLCQLLWKMAYRSSMKQRQKMAQKKQAPTFLWADESQYFLEDSDLEFLTTARSLRCINVYLTQSVSNYYAVLGSEARANAILGATNLRIFHQNSDPKTNEWASKSIGEVEQERSSVSEKSIWSWSADHSRTVSRHKQWEAAVRPSIFAQLKDGGPKNGLKVEAIVHQGGGEFHGKSWFRGVFRQS